MIGGLAVLPTPTAAVRPRPSQFASRGRVVGLDGVCGLAALFVVMNHIFLRAWPGYPVDHAPSWADEFIYGRFAVVVFIVVSGFSLALVSARSGVAAGLGRGLRAPAGVAHPAALLGRTRVQLGDDVVRPRTARLGGTRRQVGRRLRAVGAGCRPCVLVERGAQLYVLLPLLLLLVRRVSASPWLRSWPPSS
jgi:hypothetical protein